MADLRLLFHDTHHRAASDEASIADLALQDYDAVLAFGEVLRQRYLKRGWGRQVFTWHEAADTRLFFPRVVETEPAHLVWIGNWGDGERAQELDEFLIEPARRLELTGTVRGVRYPDSALAALRRTSLEYGGWIANVERPGRFCAPPRDHPRATATLCDSASGHSHHTRVRGIGVRHPPRLRPLA